MKALLTAILLALLLTGCNRKPVDLTYKFDRAIIQLPDGSVVSGEVDSWIDYTEGDQIQVEIDGVEYLTHIVNVVLIAGEEATHP